jgi:hypothetical protein
MRLAIAAGAAAVALVAAPAAHAANRFTLDPHATKPGRILLDPPGAAPGSALVAWVADAPKVCVIPSGGICGAPQTLALPADGGAVDGLFPLADGATVTLVGPRDAQGDAVEWRSIGGGPFGAPRVFRGADPGMIHPEDAVLAGGIPVIGYDTSGVGIGGIGDESGKSFAVPRPGPDVDSSSLALDAKGRPVDAYFNLGAGPFAGDSTVQVTRYGGEGPLLDPRGWSAPQAVATGIEPLLSGGAAGLFLVTQDTAPGRDLPLPRAERSSPLRSLLDVRRDDGGAFAGPPLTLADDGDAVDEFAAGAAAQSPHGRLAILWPRQGAMRLFRSDDGGESFTESDVAAIGDGYRPDRNAMAALGDDGRGLVSYIDDGGLELADFTPQSVPSPPGPPSPGPIPTPPPHGVVFDPHRGPFVSTFSRLPHGGRIALRTPGGCVRPGTVVVRVSVRGARLARVAIAYDGRLVQLRTRAPFGARFHASVAPGTRHSLTARIVVRLRGRRITRTLGASFAACSA